MFIIFTPGKPGMLDLKGKAKWNQWNNKKGMSKMAAKEAYITYANNLIQKYKWACGGEDNSLVTDDTSLIADKYLPIDHAQGIQLYIVS